MFEVHFRVPIWACVLVLVCARWLVCVFICFSSEMGVSLFFSFSFFHVCGAVRSIVGKSALPRIPPTIV
jgi:hypothetical protein